MPAAQSIMEPPRKKLRSADAPSSSFSSTLGSGKDFRKHKKEEAPIDESIYDYDAAYDALKSADAATQAAKKDDKKPRYMTNILSATELRKRDQLRARDKILQKEREEEGDEFAEKEKFVTDAYKDQQEEVKQAEEEERLREEREKEKNKKEGGGMRGFYRDLMDKDEQRHRDAVSAAAAKPTKDSKSADDGPPKEKSDADVATELRQRGVQVDVNDEGQVADKRQLLKGGLNVVSKPKAPKTRPTTAPTRPLASHSGFRPKGTGERARRERQSHLVEMQLEESLAKEAEQERLEQEKREETVQSRKTQEDISSAKERYLQRKREAAAAAAAGKT